MPLIRFNWVDIIFVILLIRTSYIGFKNGFLSDIFKFLGLVAAYIISFTSYTLISHFLMTHTRLAGTMPDIISFLLIFLIILFIFKIISSTIKVVSGNSGDISFGNRLLGLMIGLARGLLLTSLLYALLVNSSFRYISSSAKDDSLSGPYVSKIAPLVYEVGIKFYPWRTIETPLREILEK